MLAFSPRSRMMLALAATVAAASFTTPVQADNPAPRPANRPAIKPAEQLGRLPIAFEANAGQADRSIKFLARGSGYTVALTSTEALLSVSKPATSGEAGRPRIETEVLRMTLVGASDRARVEGRDLLPGRSHYYAGNDRANWHTNIPMYERVAYEAVYPGIDLVYYGNQRQLEYDFIVAPGADPRAIALAFAGARDMRIDADGALVLALSRGEIRQPAPVVYQDIRGVRKSVPGRFVIKDQETRRVAFEVGRYDTTRPLVIDPTIAYSTYLGGTSWDMAVGVAVDAAGNAYVTGFTTSGDFPTTTGPCDQSSELTYCTFVTKISAAGTLVYSTVLAGSDGRAIAIDAAGNAYVSGGAGPMLSIVNGYQPWQQGNLDGFVARLGPSGTLVYSSFIGGGGNDIALGVATDGSGHAYAVGYHNSANGLQTTANAMLTYNPSDGCEGGGATGYLVRVNTNAAGLASLDYATNIAGAGGGTNAAIGVTVDGSGNAYVAGASSSAFFPTTPGAFQTSFNGANQCWVNAQAYVVKVNTAPAACTADSVNGTGLTCRESLVYGTYVGGSTDGFANGIAIDATGNAFITGATLATDFPTTAGAPQGANAGGYDAFAAKLNASASALDYSTYLGGSADDIGHRVAVDASGRATVAGVTSSSTFPTTADALQGANAGLTDAFVTRLTATGAGPLDYSSYLGGTADDRGSDVAVDGSGNVYVTGMTYSGDFPTTPGGIQPVFGGTSGMTDGYLTKITFAPPTPEEEIESVVEDIAALPGLTPAQVGSATAKLNAALTSLANGNTTAASNQLRALTNQIRALINSRRVTPSDGQSVIDAVDGIIDQITP
jgi:hypothetical protein